MLKYVLLATAMTLSAPVLAQTTPSQTTTPAAKPDPMNNAPLGSASSAKTDPTATPPASSTPSTDTAQTAPAPMDGTTAAPAHSAQTAPAGAGGVDAVVEQEFASYDKDSNGSLSKVEFGAWMDALKAKSASGATAATDPKWNDKAFAQADTDKSKALSKVELASFLSAATKSAS